MILSALACVIISAAVKAQCEKTMKWTASKTQFMDSANNIVHEDDEAVEVQTSKTQVTIKPNGSDDDALHGDVTDYVCNWTNNNNGKITFKSVVTDPHGDVKHASFTIEEKDGKVTMLVEAEELPNNRIFLNIDSFQEVQ